MGIFVLLGLALGAWTLLFARLPPTSSRPSLLAGQGASAREVDSKTAGYGKCMVTVLAPVKAVLRGVKLLLTPINEATGT